MLSTTETAKLSGISYRQIDYWIRTGAVRNDELHGLGSGSYREIPEWYIPRLTLMGKIQRSFGVHQGLRIGDLRKIFESYTYGFVDFDGFRISWEVESDADFTSPIMREYHQPTRKEL